jgi:hypothetical protein
MFPYGFAEKAEEIYCKTPPLIQKAMEKIRSNPEQLSVIRSRAKEKNMSEELALRLEAENTVLSSSDELMKILDQMRADEKWMGYLSEKAKKNNISLEMQMEIDADWMLSQKKEGKGG